MIFFYFSFFLFCLLPCVSVLPSIYPLFRPTIAQMSFCVQLVSRGNLKRLERKYEGFVYCVWIWYYFVPILRLNVKNLKLFQICLVVR